MGRLRAAGEASGAGTPKTGGIGRQRSRDLPRKCSRGQWGCRRGDGTGPGEASRTGLGLRPGCRWPARGLVAGWTRPRASGLQCGDRGWEQLGKAGGGDELAEALAGDLQCRRWQQCPRRLERPPRRFEDTVRLLHKWETWRGGAGEGQDSPAPHTSRSQHMATWLASRETGLGFEGLGMPQRLRFWNIHDGAAGRWSRLELPGQLGRWRRWPLGLPAGPG